MQLNQQEIRRALWMRIIFIKDGGAQELIGRVLQLLQAFCWPQALSYSTSPVLCRHLISRVADGVLPLVSVKIPNKLLPHRRSKAAMAVASQLHGTPLGRCAISAPACRQMDSVDDFSCSIIQFSFLCYHSWPQKFSRSIVSAQNSLNAQLNIICKARLKDEPLSEAQAPHRSV